MHIDTSCVTQPTQFQIPSKVFKSEFPGNRIKLFISQESEWFTRSVPSLYNRKIAHGKNIEPKSYPGIQPIYERPSFNH